jgi:hypothetical protein
MGWTTALTTISPNWAFQRGDGSMLYGFGLAAASDASSSGDITLSTALTTTYGKNQSERIMMQVRGSSLHWVNYVPGLAAAEPTSLCRITVDDSLGIVVFDKTASSLSVGEGWQGNDVENFEGKFPPLVDAIIALTTLGTANTATFYFWFVK